MTNSQNIQYYEKSEEQEIQDCIAQNKYLQKMQSYVLFITYNEFERLQNGPKIKINGQELSIEYLTRMITDDKYYDYIYRYFNKDIDNFYITYLINGDTGKSLVYSKTNIFKGLEQLILSADIPLSPKVLERFEKLKSLVSFNKFFEVVKDDSYEITIDNKEYKIPVKEMLEIMFLPNSEFHELCKDRNKKNINNIPKEHFIYACFDFFVNNNIINNYLLPDEVVVKFYEIEDLKAIDLQAINCYLNIEDKLYQDVTIDSSLREAILTGMPQEANPLEKAIYIYIKMCKILTYDDEYFAVNQKGQATIKHKDINYISKITPQNNEVVCFEFNLIYSKFLSELGLNFQSDYKNMIGEEYGVAHSNVQFRYNKFLIKADSVVSILQGDLVLAKLNQPLLGLWCINKNEDTKNEFEECMTKMYNLVINQSKQVSENEITSFDDLLKQYETITKNIKSIDLAEKIDILTKKINTLDFSAVDSESYVLQIRKIIFSKKERQENVSAIIVRNNQTLTEKIASSCLIFTLNPDGFETHPSNNLYYYYAPGKPIFLVTKDELESRFQEGILEYIEADDPKIPGIKFNNQENQFASLL